ncbi:MAG: LamG domain-containing protein [Bacteroidota bacterium]
MIGLKQAILTLMIWGITTSALSQIPTNSLVAYYPFDGDANEVVGVSQSGTLQGPIATTDRWGRAGRALRFDGINDYVVLPNSVLKPSYSELSIFCWVKKDDADNRDNTWVLSANKQGSDDIRMIVDDRLVVALDDGQQPIPEVAWNPHNFQDNTWNLIGFVYDNDGLRIYANGNLVATDPDTYVPYEPLNFFIGRRSIFGQLWFKGAIDDLYIYSRAVSESEIDDIRSAGLPTGGVNPTETTWLANATGDIYFPKNVGIGTSDPAYKLAVDGLIGCEEFRIVTDVSAVPDYVFGDAYQLSTLQEVKAYIEKEHHLPNVPSAEEVARDGLPLAAMNLKLLEKIEELTLYLIQQDKVLKEHQAIIDALNQELDQL